MRQRETALGAMDTYRKPSSHMVTWSMTSCHVIKDMGKPSHWLH